MADASAGYYLRGLAPVIVFTGSTSPTTRERLPRGEAVHYRERTLLEEAGVDVDSALLVSKPYEERRAYATARKLWPEVDIVSASSPMSFEEYLESIGTHPRSPRTRLPGRSAGAALSALPWTRSGEVGRREALINRTEQKGL